MVVSKKRRIEIVIISFILCFLFVLSSMTSSGENSMTLSNSLIENGKTPPQSLVELSQDPTINTWYHDSSNLTAFTEGGNSSWMHVPSLEVSFGSLSTTGGYIYPTDYGSGSEDHGPLMYYEFPNPFPFSDFLSLEAELEIDASDANRFGKIIITLHDENNYTITNIQLSDPWVGTSAVYANSNYRFLNGTAIWTPITYPEYGGPEPYHRTLKLVQNATGLCTEMQSSKNETLLEASQVESERTVTKISIYSSLYDSWNPCEVVRIHDIKLSWNSPSTTWTNDCSNMTSFANDTDNAWALDEGPIEHNVVAGSMQSSGSYIYPTNLGSGTDWHGPLYYYTLENPFLMSNFIELQCAVELASIANNQLARLDIILNDENHAPIMGLSIHDGWAGDDANLPEAYWMFQNGSFVRINEGYANAIQTSYNETFRAFINSTGAFAELPLVGTFKLADSSEINNSRIVSYVSIHAMQWDSDPICSTIRMHNINLTYTSSASLTPLTIDHPDDIEYNESETGKSITWNPSSSVPSSYEIFKNETSVKSGSWNSTSETITISIDGLGYGVYNYTIIVREGGINYATDEVIATILDGTDPLIDTPGDVNYYEGDTGYSIKWDPTDLNPVSYEIYENESSIASGLWNASIETISISVDGLLYGIYNYTLVVTDAGGNTAFDTVWVTVDDGTDPTIDNPSNIDYFEGETGYSITWDPDDLYQVIYEIFENEGLVASGLWDADTVTISVDGLLRGDYNYTIVVTDIGGNTAVDTVWVTITDGTIPEIDNPDDVSFEVGDVGNLITWNPTDSYPESYEIFRNGTSVRTGLWNTSVETISYYVDGLNIGVYNITIIVTDIGGRTVNDVVFVVVYNIIIDHPNDIGYDEGETGNTIIWSSSSSEPSTYAIFRNGTMVENGSWDGSSISINVDSLIPGIYNYTLEVSDNNENSVNDTVIITVQIDVTTPILTGIGGGPSEFEEGLNNNTFSWTVTELNPNSYQVLRNGSEIASGNWDGSTIEVALVGLLPGVYNYTVILEDIRGNVLIDTILLTVHPDSTLPEISSPSVPDASEYEEITITWDVADLNPESYIIDMNSSVIKSGLWNSSSESISISITGLGRGLYIYTLTVLDIRGNAISDSVAVAIIDGVLPIIIGNPSITYNALHNGGNITWTVFDENPVSYVIERNGSPIVPSSGWTVSSIFLSFEDFETGVWDITLILTDIEGNTASSSVLITIEAITITTTTTDTTDSIPPLSGDVMIAVAVSGGGIGVIAILGFIYMTKLRKKPKKKEESVLSGISTETRVIGSDSMVQALRGGEFVGNRFRFKVKALNKSPFVITDVTVTLISYPRDTLKLQGDAIKNIAKIDPEGFRSPTFDFLPTQDCVKGTIIANVTYIDSRGRAHSVTTEPFQIRAVCDLLRPEIITPEEFLLKLGTLGHGEMTSKVEDWTPEEMHDKVLQILRESNFFEVSSEMSQFDDHIEAKTKGWAKGIYTGKNLGVEIIISGKSGIKGATCRIKMSGEDEAMIMPAIDEFCQKIGAWLCPKCGGALPFESVEDLKSGKSVACPFCGVTMDR